MTRRDTGLGRTGHKRARGRPDDGEQAEAVGNDGDGQPAIASLREMI